ncbi:MAG: hypothetical protein ACOVMT_08160 [Caulobacter sp.]
MARIGLLAPRWRGSL